MNSACSAQLLSEVEFSKCSRSGNTKHGDVNPASGMVQKYKKESEFTKGKLKMGRATGRLTISARKKATVIIVDRRVVAYARRGVFGI